VTAIPSLSVSIPYVYFFFFLASNSLFYNVINTFHGFVILVQVSIVNIPLVMYIALLISTDLLIILR